MYSTEYDSKAMKERINAYRKRRRRLWIAGIATGTLAVMFTVFLACAMNCGDSHDDGYSIGTLINVRHEGMLWSRPAATLLHSGEMKGDEFAMDPGLYQQAMKAADARARVKVGYSERYTCWAWNYASCRIITSIAPDPGTK